MKNFIFGCMYASLIIIELSIINAKRNVITVERNIDIAPQKQHFVSFEKRGVIKKVNVYIFIKGEENNICLGRLTDPDSLTAGPAKLEIGLHNGNAETKVCLIEKVELDVDTNHDGIPDTTIRCDKYRGQKIGDVIPVLFKKPIPFFKVTPSETIDPALKTI